VLYCTTSTDSCKIKIVNETLTFKKCKLLTIVYVTYMSTVMLILVTFSGQKSTGNHVQGLLKGAG
jgi:hypothetical protein